MAFDQIHLTVAKQVKSLIIFIFPAKINKELVFQSLVRHIFLDFIIAVHPAYGQSFARIERDRSKVSISIKYFKPVENPFATLRVYLLSSNRKRRQKFHEKTLDWCRTLENPYSDFFVSMFNNDFELCPIKEVNHNCNYVSIVIVCTIYHRM